MELYRKFTFLHSKRVHEGVPIIASNMDTEKTSVAALSRALEERDRQIDTLKKRLDEAAGDILVDADLMDEVRLELKQSESVALAAAAAACMLSFLF